MRNKSLNETKMDNGPVTPSMRRKWSRVFDMKDLRGVGKVEEQDFVEWGRRVAQNVGVKYTDTLKDAWKTAHQAYFGSNVTKEAWIRHLSGFVSGNTFEAVLAMSVKLNKKIMEGCADANGDGVVDWNEFWCFMEPLGVTEEGAKAAFIACDTDKNGTLDADEFATACAKYYYDREMSTFADFYGPFYVKDEIVQTRCCCIFQFWSSH